MSVIATPPRTVAAISASEIHMARRAVVVVASVGIAFALTLLLGPVIARAIFVFLYAAVAVSGMYAGLRGGIAAALASAALVDYFLIPPTHSLIVDRGVDAVSVLAFVVMSSLLSGLMAQVRTARRVAEESSGRLREQTMELEAQQEELQALAEELEESNVELESAMDDANAARDDALESETRMRLLDEASRVLASSLDYEATVAAVARLAVPEFADWCAVDLLVDGKIKQLAIAHVDPGKVSWARELSARYPVDVDGPTGVPAVIRTGNPQFIPTVTDGMLRASARDEEHLAILRQVGVHSVMIVPISARGARLGALTLIRARAGNPYNEQELVTACDVGRRAAMAIDNARLYRAALAANEAKANFLATMSHELRTPLTAIIGYEELLAEGITGSVSDAQRQQLQRIKLSALHLLSLIEEILLYARVEAGRETVHVEPVVAKVIVEDAISFVAPAVADRNIAVRAEPIDPSLVVRTDPGKLRQMLVNLLANAVKFTPEGKIAVRGFADGPNVVFEVQDTGIGIAPEHLENIFAPFWQVEQHTTRRAGGSGLGLAVTRNLATLLGGTVSVESVPGVGSTFRITVPA